MPCAARACGRSRASVHLTAPRRASRYLRVVSGVSQLEKASEAPKGGASLSLRGLGLSLLIGAIVAVALTVWSDHGRNRRTTDDIEQTIRTGLKSQGLARGKITVTCPTIVEWHPGRSFACLATGGARPRGIAVTMGRTTADYTWND